ncbi:MAG TPA: hypothetical protein VLG40_00725 [Candidatus Saccharimonas sp.]|nr:hypothetical protein [Candidatus Saccharimonas sp.]
MRKRRPKPWPADKNPLHPSALRVRDIRLGLKFVTFDIYAGVIMRGTFQSSTFVDAHQNVNARACVNAMIARQGTNAARLVDLAYLGIARFGGVSFSAGSGWSSTTFTVAVNKVHLLPALKPYRSFGVIDRGDDWGYTTTWRGLGHTGLPPSDSFYQRYLDAMSNHPNEYPSSWSPDFLERPNNTGDSEDYTFHPRPKPLDEL